MTANGPEPELSYVLATDAPGTVRGVLAHLERQSRASAIELVLVSPQTLEAADRDLARGFAAVRCVRSDQPLELSAARALGVRAATAPVVFIGETHSFPEPEMVERLLEVLTDGCDAAVPAVLNANPSSARSRAAYLLDYSAWGPGRGAGTTSEPLVYNAAYRREALLALGDGLADALSSIDHDLWTAWRAAGRSARFEPSARIRHLNTSTIDGLLRERWLCGLRFGHFRAQRWGWPRRLLFAGASPLVPVVLLARALGSARRDDSRRRIDPLTAWWLVVAAATRAAGEGLGYLGFGAGAVAAETEIELHRSRYVESGT